MPYLAQSFAHEGAMGLQKGQTILLGGFDARSYLNGQEGILLHRDRDTGRCRVRLSDPPWATVKVPMSSVRQSDGRTQTTKEIPLKSMSRLESCLFLLVLSCCSCSCS